MDSVIRAVFFYLLVLFALRWSPKRSLVQLTPFELVLMLMLGGVAIPAIQADDRSMTNAVVLISTLLGMHVLLAWLKRRYEVVGKIISGTPLLLVEEGKRHQDRMAHLLIEDQDLLAAARSKGAKGLDDVRWVIAERNGELVAILKESG